MGGRSSAMRFTERMTTGDERDDFLVVHPHIAESGTDGRSGRSRITAVIRTFRVHVNQPHFRCAQRRFCQFFRMAVFKPGSFVTPVHVQIRFPDVFATGTKTKGAEARIFQRDVTRQDVEICPGNFLTIFLLHRPQQAARFIEADVIRPGVERREALLTAS